jgi:NAD(P)-dependent dehydrogenase (short-subunit alcohol dehydrogenase family)
MEPLLQDKVIVVAGCGGIGDSLVERYASEGAFVVAGDLDHERAVGLAERVDPGSERVVATALDGGDEASIAAIVALATTRFGKLDGFHANYAYFGGGMEDDGLEIPIEILDESLRVNSRGFFLCARHAVRAMSDGGGSIVFTSSIDAHQGAPFRVAYQMSKASTHALMRHVARRYGRYGIRANVITPGLIVHHRMGMSEEHKDVIRRRNALKTRLGGPEDIAAMGAFLLSDESGYVTGQVLTVDGGMTMRP